MSPAVISCAGVSKTFPILDGNATWRAVFSEPRAQRSIPALEEIALEVPKGEFLGILGRNGAGKSTLLRTLAGVLQPDRGEICIQGSVCGLFELGGLGNRHITGRQYAERWLALNGIPWRRRQSLVEEIADFSELGDRFDTRILTYSTGMAARLYFSAATALRHDVYLIDEILSVGDQHFQDKCWRRLRERFEHGASGVLVTHDWSAALRLCRESCILERGRIIARGPSEAIIVRYLGLERLEGRVARIGLPGGHRFDIEAGRDADLAIPVELTEDVPVAIGYALEAMRVGYGWEILFHENFMPVADRAGKYEVNLRFDRIPIAPGEYRLSVFTTSPKITHGGPAFRIYDGRSWTYGNSLMVAVSGAPRPGALLHPAQWTIAGEGGGDAHQN